MERFCIDASVFLGMNSNNENIRVSCKNFFIKNLNAEIFMNFEQVGLCDDVIWSFPFELQTAYYPFMDLFHSIMPIKRLPYTTHTLSGISNDSSLPLIEKLNVVFAREHNAVIYSLKMVILDQHDIKKTPVLQNERIFCKSLEIYYQESLQLVIDMDSIFHYVR
ncbi:MAG: DUF6190 family protein [Pyrinomonadaceae bacterium]